jgi:hypothetical protein
MVLLLACYDGLAPSKGETRWIADLTTSPALDAIAHSPL